MGKAKARYLEEIARNQGKVRGCVGQAEVLGYYSEIRIRTRATGKHQQKTTTMCQAWCQTQSTGTIGIIFYLLNQQKEFENKIIFNAGNILPAYYIHLFMSST